MPISLTLPVRTWAALDAALQFFRSTPLECPAAQRRARHCRRLHNVLQRSGVRSLYVPVGELEEGRALLRLHVRTIPTLRRTLTLELPLPVARNLAKTAITILQVQATPGADGLTEHEAEELQAIQAFLSEMRRNNPSTGPLFPERRAGSALRWDRRHNQYVFAAPLAHRLHMHYLRAGAGLN